VLCLKKSTTIVFLSLSKIPCNFTARKFLNLCLLWCGIPEAEKCPHTDQHSKEHAELLQNVHQIVSMSNHIHHNTSSSYEQTHNTDNTVHGITFWWRFNIKCNSSDPQSRQRYHKATLMKSFITRYITFHFDAGLLHT
jgi:hypothetical protein